MYISYLSLVTGFFLAASAGVLATEKETILDAWLTEQKNLSTWSADFIQTRSLSALKHPLISTGRVWFAKPNRFRWELGTPAQTIAVRDEKQLRIIYPRLKREERYGLTGKGPKALSETLGFLDAGFPTDRTDFKNRFRLLSLDEAGNAWRICFQPVSTSARKLMPEIVVTVGKTQFQVLANELVFQDGSRMRNEFSNIVTNREIPPGVFNPQPKADFKIIQKVQ